MKYRTPLAIACFAAAFVLLAYPLAGRLLSEKYHADLIYRQTESVENTDPLSIQKALMDADAYNYMLSSGSVTSVEDGRTLSYTEYDNLLNLNGDGIMGTIEIPVLHLELPIAHGTDPRTLERAIGHVIGSSLPVGGQSTHAVLSGHSGLATSRIFSDLEQLQQGDRFILHVLGMDLWYQVDQISVVLPTDTTALSIIRGQDCVTLVTCTPYGINTHRLLVRGIRITPEEVPEVEEERSHTWTSQDDQVLAVIFGCSAIFLITCFFVRRRCR